MLSYVTEINGIDLLERISNRDNSFDPVNQRNIRDFTKAVNETKVKILELCIRFQKMMSRKNRRGLENNGCQCPWNIFVIITYLVWFVEFVIFAILICPYLWYTLHPGLSTVLILTISILLLVSYTTGLIWILTDQVDPLLKHGRKGNRADFDFEWINCNSYVHISSKHCKTCDKWTKGFDHHWIWLNNCIGYRNYRYFFTWITAYMIVSVGLIALSIPIMKEPEEIDYLDKDIGIMISLVIYVTVKALITLYCSLFFGCFIFILLVNKWLLTNSSSTEGINRNQVDNFKVSNKNESSRSARSSKGKSESHEREISVNHYEIAGEDLSKSRFPTLEKINK